MNTTMEQVGCKIQCAELRLVNELPRLFCGKIQLCIATDYYWDDEGNYSFDGELKLYCPEDAYTCKLLKCNKFANRGYIESIVGDKIIFHIAVGPKQWENVMRFQNTLVVRPTAINWFNKYCSEHTAEISTQNGRFEERSPSHSR